MTIPFFSFFEKLLKRFFSRSTLFFWFRHYKILFFFGLFIISLSGAWTWYQSLYRYHMSDDEKKQYVDSYFKETIFEETKFHEIVDDLAARARRHEETLPLIRNIFKGEGIQPKK